MQFIKIIFVSLLQCQLHWCNSKTDPTDLIMPDLDFCPHDAITDNQAKSDALFKLICKKSFLGHSGNQNH